MLKNLHILDFLDMGGIEAFVIPGFVQKCRSFKN